MTDAAPAPAVAEAETETISTAGVDFRDAIVEMGFRVDHVSSGYRAVELLGDRVIGPFPTPGELEDAVREETATDPPAEDDEPHEAGAFKGRNETSHPTRPDAIPTLHINEEDVGTDNDPIINAAKRLREYDRQHQILEMFPMPEKKDFEGKQFLASEDLKTVAETLIEKYPNDFSHLVEANIVYLWKEAGGETGGMATLGKCIRPSGLAAYFAAPDAGANVDYIIWCAADHLRDNKANYRTICALLFHELCHTRVQDGKFIVVGHEFEGYAREIEEFGMWQHSIKRIAEACETVKDVQQGLFTNHE